MLPNMLNLVVLFVRETCQLGHTMLGCGHCEERTLIRTNKFQQIIILLKSRTIEVCILTS